MSSFHYPSVSPLSLLSNHHAPFYALLPRGGIFRQSANGWKERKRVGLYPQRAAFLPLVICRIGLNALSDQKAPIFQFHETGSANLSYAKLQLRPSVRLHTLFRSRTLHYMQIVVALTGSARIFSPLRERRVESK